MDIDYKALGRRIKEARTAAEITQEALAEMAGISLPHVSNIETGNTKVSLPTLVKIANALTVSLDPLLCDSVKNSKPVFIAESMNTFDDCTEFETRVLVDILKSSKMSLRKNAPFNE